MPDRQRSIAFDHAAEYYDQTRGFPPGIESEVAAFLTQVGDFDSHTRLLEIGVGTGRIALPLAAQIKQVVGIDLARPMLVKLLEKCEVQPVYPFCADATRLPFRTDTFTALVHVHVLHLIPNWQDAVSEAVRVLRPGGVMIQGWGGPNLGSVWDEWRAQIGEARVDYVGAQDDDLSDHLTKLGWQIGDTQKMTYPQMLNLANYVTRYEERTWSSTWRMTAAQHIKAAALLRETLTKHYGDLDQTISITGSFHARKYVKLPGGSV